MGKTKVENMEDILEALENEQERPVEESFLDLHEPALMEDFDYRQLQKNCKKYGYAVTNVEASFEY